MTKSINVTTLREMFLAAAANLAVHEEEINAHNVFPVPDGDTGTNMCLTAQTAATELAAIPEGDLTFAKLASVLTAASLRGARGNSGVILSQIYKGFADVISSLKEDLTPKVFSKALSESARIAYGAVNQPKEGTILTVMREIAESSVRAAKGSGAAFEPLLTTILERGRLVLADTPNMLPVLKKAGVVDAGGIGLICVFEAFSMVIEGKEIPKKAVAAEVSVSEDEKIFAADVHDLDDIEFAYCTEFFVKNLRPNATATDIDKLRDKLSKLGNSLICIGDLDLIKVHVHTNQPGKALSYALELGELDRVKVENMLEQNRKIKEELERTKKPIGMVAVCAGSGIKKIFRDLSVDIIVEGGQTMNPSVNEILSAINRVNADHVIVLPNNKNIILAAEKAKDIASRDAVVIPTESVAAGIAAVIAFDPIASFEDNVKSMKEAFAAVTCAQVTTAVRNTKMDGLSLKKGDIIGLSDKKILVKGSDVTAVTVDLVKKMGFDKKDVLNVYYGEGMTMADTEALTEWLEETCPDLEVIVYEGNQPHSFYILSAE